MKQQLQCKKVALLIAIWKLIWSLDRFWD